MTNLLQSLSASRKEALTATVQLELESHKTEGTTI